MDLSPYLHRLAEDLEKVTALADDHTRETTARPVSAIEPSLRMVLLEAVSDTAALVTADLDDVVAVVRMEGRDPVVTVEQTATDATTPLPVSDPDEGDDARVTLRLPQSLKQRAETQAGEADQSLNTFIVQAIRRATSDGPGPQYGPRSALRATQAPGSRRVTGWA